jgi:hypothetical protein
MRPVANGAENGRRQLGCWNWSGLDAMHHDSSERSRCPDEAPSVSRVFALARVGPVRGVFGRQATSFGLCVPRLYSQTAHHNARGGHSRHRRGARRQVRTFMFSSWLCPVRPNAGNIEPSRPSSCAIARRNAFVHVPVVTRPSPKPGCQQSAVPIAQEDLRIVRELRADGFVR